jgi:hypothetical protein
MIVEGKILSVMESWPLQLTIETRKNEKIYVTLLLDTRIFRNSYEVDCKELMPNSYVRIEGDYQKDNLAITAQSIEILD